MGPHLLLSFVCQGNGVNEQRSGLSSRVSCISWNQCVCTALSWCELLVRAALFHQLYWGRGGMHSPVMVCVVGSFFVSSLSPERCACCGLPRTTSYKHLKNVDCNQCPFYRFSL